MASYRESSAAAFSIKEPSPSMFEPNYASDSPYPFLRSYKLDSTISEVYEDELYKPSMQNVPKTISPKDALLEDLDALLEDLNDAEEDDMAYLFTKSEMPGVSALNPGNVLHKDKNNNQTEKVEPLATKNHPSKPRRLDRPSRSQRLLRGTLGKMEAPPSDEDSPPGHEPSEGLEALPEMLLQPDTRPISHEQLVVELEGIWAGLVMVEAKCTDIDESQSAAAQEKDPSKKTDLKNDQWQSLIALHKQLLHEHHDFFLASQHPSASPALSRLAANYSMPARMWRHGDKLYNPPMQNVPKTISPKDALLDGIRRLSRKVSPGLSRPATFKRQEGEKRERLTPVESTSGVGSLLRTKQGLVGFANGSRIAAMADTGSRTNVISASYAKKLDLSIEGLPSTFAIGSSRKIQSLGKYIPICCISL
ncbi:hypothetical protein HO173_011822 [Letharia columbiana]|uniref:Uncharacterized protein n=1 Tax=Letharia columbiana TaxID=112416 RepID=A0A8H6CS65_9LECA|nr:uncharacterized protein HO173_011822 [Letharia columbiana]KAF6228587.1 hypothetical protein HO173_011822 [Letharia columbiana]